MSRLFKILITFLFPLFHVLGTWNQIYSTPSPWQLPHFVWNITWLTSHLTYYLKGFILFSINLQKHNTTRTSNDKNVKKIFRIFKSQFYEITALNIKKILTIKRHLRKKTQIKCCILPLSGRKNVDVHMHFCKTDVNFIP